MILVTGATGLVGTHLLVKLVQEKYTIRALYRTEEKRIEAKNVFCSYFKDNTGSECFEAIDWCKASITDIPLLEEAFQGITEVYHCAALISFDPKDYKRLRKVNIEGTANIVNISLLYEVEKLCYVSSIATLGEDISKVMIDETATWNSENINSVYAITKYGAEMEVWRGIQEGLNAVIVNPGIIIGPGFFDHGSGLLFKKINQGFRYYTTGVTGYVSITDVIQVMYKLMTRGCMNDRYIVVGENLTYRSVFTMIAKALDKPIPKIKVTPLVLRIMYYVQKIASLFFRSQRTIFKPSLESAFSSSNYDHQKVKKELMYSFMPIEKAIETTAICFLNQSS